MTACTCPPRGSLRSDPRKSLSSPETPEPRTHIRKRHWLQARWGIALLDGCPGAPGRTASFPPLEILTWVPRCYLWNDALPVEQAGQEAVLGRQRVSPRGRHSPVPTWAAGHLSSSSAFPARAPGPHLHPARDGLAGARVRETGVQKSWRALPTSVMLRLQSGGLFRDPGAPWREEHSVSAWHCPGGGGELGHQGARFPQHPGEWKEAAGGRPPRPEPTGIYGGSQRSLWSPTGTPPDLTPGNTPLGWCLRLHTTS